MLTRFTSLKQRFLQIQIQIGKAKIPRILLGTSPFIGAGQFGVRAYRYYLHFYENPRNIIKIILKAADLGIAGIQVLPYRPIFEALKAAQNELGEKLTVVGTIGSDDRLGDLRRFQGFKIAALLLHGEITDRRNREEINELLNRIRAAGYLAGLVTHRPFSTLNWLLKADLDIDLIMLPFNKLGMFMDTKPKEIIELIKLLGKPVIGKKVLAAGRIQPRDALNFVAQSRCIDLIALGIASEKEAEETFSVAAETFSGVFRI